MIIIRDHYFPPAGANRRLHICLPDNYYKTQERYPVMYFFDGHNLFSDAEATYGKSWGLSAFLSRWNRPMIIVGMECSHEGNERLVEYCPYNYRGKFWGDIHGTGKATLEHMAGELKPEIDREFRTYSFREATGIGGSSMGGLMALFGVCMYNETFSKALCLSSAVGPGIKELLGDIGEAALSPDTRIYLSWGEEEAKYGRRTSVNSLLTRTAQNHYLLQGLLLQKGCAVDLYCQPGGHHCEADWEKQLPRGMDFLWNG